MPSSTPTKCPTSVPQTYKPASPVPSSSSNAVAASESNSTPEAGSTSRYNEIMSMLTGDDIIKIFETDALPHLKNVLSGKENSWRFDVFTGKSQEVKRRDLTYNVHTGCFPEDQVGDLLDLIQEHFPCQTLNCKVNILLPECLIKIVQNFLHMTKPEAESYLRNSKDSVEVDDFMEKQKQRANAKEKNIKKRKSGHTSSSLPKRTKRDHHNITISQGLPDSARKSFIASCPEFTLTPQGKLLVEMIVNGKIKFEGDQNVSTDDLKSLSCFNCKKNEEKWLSNFTIEAYLKLIKLASAAQGRNVDFFKSEEFEKKYIKELLKGKDNPLDQDLVFIPLLNSHHWTLAVVIPKQKQILVLDSLASSHIKPITYTRMHRIMSLLQCDPSFKPSEWSFTVNLPEDIPQQLNNFDCGVFICMYARSLAVHIPVIKQPSINAARRVMVLELHQETLFDMKSHLKAKQIIVPK